MDNEMETRVTLGFGGFRKTGDPSCPCNQDDSFRGAYTEYFGGPTLGWLSHL